METLNQMSKRIGHTQDLRSVVTIMKSAAAVSIRQYEQAAEALQDFMRTVEAGLSIVMQGWQGGVQSMESRPGSGLGVIVFGSRQGMCGQFNEVIAEYVNHFLKDLQQTYDLRRLHVAVLGNRVEPMLDKVSVSYRFQLPGSIELISESVQSLLKTVESWRSQNGVARVILLYNHKTAGSGYQPRSVQLFPLDRSWLEDIRGRMPPYRTLPEYSMDRERLFSALIRQWFFYASYQAFAESLASENASRLASMQSAEKNIQEYLDGLRQKYNQKRQDAITGELLDIIGGYEALR